jgi:hypothetical protein
LRSVRFNVWRERLAADLVLAIANQNFCGTNAREHSCDCQPKQFPAGNDGLFKTFAAVGPGAVAATDGSQALARCELRFFPLGS